MRFPTRSPMDTAGLRWAPDTSAITYLQNTSTKLASLFITNHIYSTQEARREKGSLSIVEGRSRPPPPSSRPPFRVSDKLFLVPPSTSFPYLRSCKVETRDWYYYSLFIGRFVFWFIFILLFFSQNNNRSTIWSTSICHDHIDIILSVALAYRTTIIRQPLNTCASPKEDVHC